MSEQTTIARKCIRCGSDMIEELKITDNRYSRLLVRDIGFMKPAVGRIKAALCPECGYVETYIDLNELQGELERLMENREEERDD